MDIYYILNNYNAFEFIFFVLLIALLVGLTVAKKIKFIFRGELEHELIALRAAFDSSPNPIYARDSSGRLVMCNSRYLEITGKSINDLLNKKVFECSFNNFEKSNALLLHEEYLEVIACGVPKFLKRNVQCVNGKEIAIHHWLQPYRNSQNKVVGFVGGWIDITEQEMLLEKLRVAKVTAEEANRAKTIFLAIMSHELRTPLSAVIGMLEVSLSRKFSSDNEYKELEVAHNAATDLLDLLSDILDMSRIESGNMSLTPVRTNFTKLIDSVVSVFEYSAGEKKLKFNINFDLDDSFDVMLDPIRVKQVFSNLLSNSVRYTNCGEISLDVILKSNTDGSGANLWFCVKDTGEGISDKDMEKLFSPFSYVGNSQFGSGLGLVITRTICELMGGQLIFSSEVGVGTKAEVSLQLETIPKVIELDSSFSDALPRVDSMQVLVVDDYPASRFLMSLQLNRLGHSAELADNGADAFEKWKLGNFDAVLTDCNMPVMTGYELAVQIREYENKFNKDECLIFGFTAGGNANEEKRCIDAGMNACLFKPVNFKDLGLIMGESRFLSVGNGMGDCLIQTADYVELNNLSYLYGRDKDDVLRLLSLLLSSNREDVIHINGSIVCRDYSKILESTHRIKGGGKMIGAKQLIQCCNQVELACLAQDFDKLLLAVEVLRFEIDKLDVHLQSLVV